MKNLGNILMEHLSLYLNLVIMGVIGTLAIVSKDLTEIFLWALFLIITSALTFFIDYAVNHSENYSAPLAVTAQLLAPLGVVSGYFYLNKAPQLTSLLMAFFFCICVSFALALFMCNKTSKTRMIFSVAFTVPVIAMYFIMLNKTSAVSVGIFGMVFYILLNFTTAHIISAVAAYKIILPLWSFFSCYWLYSAVTNNWGIGTSLIDYPWNQVLGTSVLFLVVLDLFVAFFCTIFTVANAHHKREYGF